MTKWNDGFWRAVLKKNHKQFVKQALVDLGSDPLMIAKNLADWQIKGKRKDHRACPIANYVSSQLALHQFPETDVVIRASVVLLYEKDASSAWGNHEEKFIDFVDLPHCVESFVDKFDNGRFDELEG